MFEKAVAFVLCAFVLGLAGLIIYLTHKGWGRYVSDLRDGKNPVPPVAVRPVKKVAAKKKPAKKKRRR